MSGAPNWQQRLRDKAAALVLHRLKDAPVAQLDRVLDYESRGRGFESLPVHHSSHRLNGASKRFGNVGRPQRQ